MPNIQQLILVFVVAGMLSAALTILVIRLSSRLNFIALPEANRWHKTPTPNTGGIAILISCAASYLIFAREAYSQVAAAALAVALLGILDDRLNLRPLVKFAGQSVIVLSVMAAGIVYRPFSWELANLAVTFLWIIGVTNAFNLIDNMDGLCAGVVIIIGGFRCLVALQSGDFYGAIISAIVVGAFSGFLVFNYNPARIFMGDAGSMFAGFALATLTIAGPAPRARAFLSALFYPALTFLYPIFDTTLVATLRRLTGRPISVGGRDHSSHRLVSLGHREKKVVWLLWALTALGAAAGWLGYWNPLVVHVVGALLLGGATLFGLFLATLPDFELPSAAATSGIRRLVPTLRIGVNVVVECLLAAIALMGAFIIRWEHAFAGIRMEQFLFSLPVVMASQITATLALRTFNIGWRWFSLADALRLLHAAMLSTAMTALAVLLLEQRDYSRGILVLFGILTFLFTSGLRVTLRVLRRILGATSGRARAAILGGMEDASVLIHALEHDAKPAMTPVLFLDTDVRAVRGIAFGVPGHRLTENSYKLIKRYSVECLTICARHPLMSDHQAFLDFCSAKGIKIYRFHYDISPIERVEDTPKSLKKVVGI